MKNFHGTLATALLGLFMVSNSPAALVTGIVQCDLNQNGTNDTSDRGLANVLVVITNQSGSFSNATFTAANGSFSLQIPTSILWPNGETRCPRPMLKRSIRPPCR